MKNQFKLFIFLGLTLLLINGGEALADSPNLILNPGFEETTGSTPSHWLAGGYGTNDRTFTYPIVGPNGGADKAAKITVTSFTDGDAKWAFETVQVIPGGRYAFRDNYISDTNTQVAAIFCADLNCLTPDFTHGQWTNFAPTPVNTWATATAEFLVPDGASYVTIYHLLYSAGSLSLDNFSLTELPPVTPLSKGFVSITFDDGWESQYVNAFPILKNAGFKGSFYIISNAIASSAPGTENILCNDPANPLCNGAVITTTSSSWKAANQYPDPLQNTYTFSETYTSNAAGILTISYFNSSGQTIKNQQNILIPVLEAGTNKSATVGFTLPAGTAYFTMSQSVPTGKTLQVVSATLNSKPGTEDSYMTGPQILEMQAAGQEIGAHTEDHCDLGKIFTDPNSAMSGACASPTGAPKTAEQEINGSRLALLNLGATPVDTLAYPYGGFNSNVESLVKDKGFIGARSVIVGYNNKASDVYALKTQLITKSLTDRSDGLSTVKSWIDYANQNKVWLILTFHNVEKSSDLAANFAANPTEVAEATSADFFKSIVDYLKSSNTCISTMHDGVTTLNSSLDPICNLVVTTPADLVPPVITLNGSSTINLLVGDTYTEQGALATDNMDPSVEVVIGGGTVNTATTSVYHLTYDAVDVAGNHAVQVTRTVNVTAPVVVVTPPAETATPPVSTTPPSGGGGGGGGGSSGGGGRRNPPLTATATSTGQVLGASTFKFTITTYFGSSGKEVTELQKRLIAEGIYKGPITGYFGSLTESAVKVYQKKYGLEAVGIVGPKTRQKLNGSATSQTSNISSMSVSQMQALIKDLEAQLAVLMKQLSVR